MTTSSQIAPQHTPGPWTAEPDGYVWTAPGPDGREIVASTWDTAQGRADARLIAVSPRMLAALRDLHASAMHAYKYRPTDAPSGFQNAMRDLVDTMDRARAAIAAATQGE